MKHRYFFMLAFSVVILLAAIIFNPLYVCAGETIKYSCSNQVYQALDKEKIDMFSQKTGIKVQVFVSSSRSAIYRLMNNFSDIASTAQELKHRENTSHYTQTPICKDPLAVIVHAKCGVSNISAVQLQKVLGGQISNWQELGGDDLPLSVVIPGIDTAAYKNIHRQIMNGGDIKYDFMAYDSTMAMKAVSYFPCGTISVITQGAVINNPEIQTIKVDSVSPSDSDYPYFQNFYYVTKGKPQDAVKAFIEFSFSQDGLNIMKNRGLIAANQ